MSDLVTKLLARAAAARAPLAIAETGAKNAALDNLASSLRAARPALLRANQDDVASAHQAGLSAALLDRLSLDANRIEQLATAVEAVRALPDPVGEVADGWRRPNGLEISRVRIPLGVILVVYEARPNVTTDAAALCLKSGNAVILRGGSEAQRTNGLLAELLSAALASAGLPPAAAQLVPDPDRALLSELLGAQGQIDLCICRGGRGLLQFAAAHARVPVVPHAEGVVHVFVDAGSNVPQATRILVNAKAQRPGVCNAAECLLVHREIAQALLPEAGGALAAAGVELRADPTALALLRRARVPAIPAQEADFGREFLDKILAVRVVPDLGAALEHIARYGSGHTEAILTPSLDSARRFEREVLASVVVVNASTRFNDGGELGLGAEIGISTGRLHAYGPMGLRELCSQKFVVRGQGQVRS